jgi:purine-binding chemotaxis protein CheW
MTATAIATAARDIVTFRIGDLTGALAIDEVREIIRPRAITPVHGATPEVLGVMNLRGQIVTLIDLTLRMTKRKMVAPEKGRVILVRYREELTGLMVDDVDDSVTIAAHDILPPPGHLNGLYGDIVSNVCRLEHQLVLLFNLQALMATGGTA